MNTKLDKTTGVSQRVGSSLAFKRSVRK